MSTSAVFKFQVCCENDNPIESNTGKVQRLYFKTTGSAGSLGMSPQDPTCFIDSDPKQNKIGLLG